MTQQEQLREQLADLCHQQWSGWMEYLFSLSVFNRDCSVTIPRKLVRRWRRQVATDFKKLSESEQNSDYKEADKFLEILNQNKL